MPITISGKKFYRTQEALELIGLPRSTFFKWLKEEKVEDVKYKDRNGWRLFTDDDIKKPGFCVNGLRGKNCRQLAGLSCDF